MSSISVTYGLRTIKLKTTSSSPISELLEKSVAHFKLNATDSYGLFHQSNQLSNLPLRLLNLPQGAKLELKKTSAKPTLIQIKVVIFNNPQGDTSSVIKKLLDSANLRELIQELENDLGFSIIGTSYKLKLQGISGLLQNEDSTFTNFEKTTLKSFGLENNSMLRITFVQQTVIQSELKQAPVDEKISEPEVKRNKPEPSPQPESEPVTPSLDQSPEPVQIDTEDTQKSQLAESKDLNLNTLQRTTGEDEDAIVPDSNVSPETPQISVFQALTQQISHYEPSDSTYDLSIPQLKQYQEMLSAKAHENPRQAALRKAKIQKKKLENLKTVEIRIKFPNLIFVDFSISSHVTQEELYQYVTDTFLNDKNVKYELYTPGPFTRIERNSQKLIKSFEARNLLLFQTEEKSDNFLKSEFLQNVKDIAETEAVKLDSAIHDIPNDDDDEMTKASFNDSKDEKLKTRKFPFFSDNDSKNFKGGSKESKLKNLLRLGKK